MIKITTAILLACFMLACEGEQGPMGPPGQQGQPGGDAQIISIVGQVGSFRSSGFFEIFNTTIRANDAVTVYVGVDSPITNWASCEFAYGDGFALIYDPNYSLVGWYYLVRIIRNPEDQ